MKFRLNCEALEQRENPADLPFIDPITGIAIKPPLPPIEIVGPPAPNITWYPNDFVGPLPPNGRYEPLPEPPAPPAPPYQPSTGPIVLPGPIFPLIA